MLDALHCLNIVMNDSLTNFNESLNISVLQRRKLRFSDLMYLTQVHRVSLSPVVQSP